MDRRSRRIHLRERRHPVAQLDDDHDQGVPERDGGPLGHFSYILDFVDSLQKVRIYIPDGQITTRGDTTYKNGEATPLPVTITAYPDGSGNNAYKWVDHDITVST
jgi:hypothetical protein